MMKSKNEQNNINPLRTQPDYGEKELYEDIIKVSNLVSKLYNEQLCKDKVFTELSKFYY